MRSNSGTILFLLLTMTGLSGRASTEAKSPAEIEPTALNAKRPETGPGTYVYGKWSRTVHFLGMDILVEFDYSADQTSETVTCSDGGVTQSVTAMAPSQITDTTIAINGTDEESVTMSNGYKCHVTLSPETYGYTVTDATLTLKTTAGSFDFQREN